MGERGTETGIRQPFPLDLPFRRSHFRLQDCTQRVGDPVRLQYDFAGAGGWHPETGVVQSDSEGRTRAWEIPWWYVVSVSNCGD